MRRQVLHGTLLVVFALTAGQAHAYILQLESYDGSAYAQAQGPNTWDDDTGQYTASVSLEGDLWGCGATATNDDLTGGGGVGEGTYLIGRSFSEASAYSASFDCSSSATGSATYTWRLLSEYANTGVVTLTLSGYVRGQEGFEYNPGSGEADISVTSDLDSWASPYHYWRSDPWEQTVSFDVTIGSTIQVTCYSAAGAPVDYLHAYASADATSRANLTLPEEIPEPTALALLAGGALIALRRRRY